jgi:hypothetical protein
LGYRFCHIHRFRDLPPVIFPRSLFVTIFSPFLVGAGPRVAPPLLLAHPCYLTTLKDQLLVPTAPAASFATIFAVCLPKERLLLGVKESLSVEAS